jgi:hypothetical protein
MFRNPTSSNLTTLPSIHRRLRLRILALHSSLESTILLCILLLPILCRCPAHRTLLLRSLRCPVTGKVGTVPDSSLFSIPLLLAMDHTFHIIFFCVSTQ